MSMKGANMNISFAGNYLIRTMPVNPASKLAEALNEGDGKWASLSQSDPNKVHYVTGQELQDKENIINKASELFGDEYSIREMVNSTFEESATKLNLLM